MKGNRWIKRLVWAVALAALLLAACTPQQLVQPAPRSIPAPSPTPERTPPLQPAQGLALVQEAYALLLQRFVDPVDPAALLQAGWDGMQKELATLRGALADLPPLGQDPAEQLTTFAAAYLQAVAGQPAAEQRRLAYAAIRAMAHSLDDCHTGFATAQQFREQTERLQGRGRFGGGSCWPVARRARRGSSPATPSCRWTGER